MTCEGCARYDECDKAEWCNKLTQWQRNFLSTVIGGYLSEEEIELNDDFEGSDNNE